MGKPVELRPLTEEELESLQRLSRMRKAPNRLVERARMVLWAHQGKSPAQITTELGRHRQTVYRYLKRFNARGLAGLDDEPRPGRPWLYSEEERGQIIATARTHPQKLGRPYGHWTLSRLVEYLNHEMEIGISRAQLARVLQDEGLRWYQEKTYFTERPDPQFAEKRGR